MTKTMRATNCVGSRPACRIPMRVCCVARPQQAALTTSPSRETITPAQWLSVAVCAPLLLSSGAALAIEGDAAAPPHELLKGTTFALIHPAMNFFLLGSSFYAAYLGWQWRRTRTMGEEIRALKASTAAAAGAASADSPPAPNPQIQAMEQERTALVKGGFKDKHHMWGSLLLASGTGMAISGAANTFMRTGKLFPGPHLYAGATIVALWALAAALTPAMQKGNETARNAHIALNTIQIGLFLWQVPTGLDIVAKVFEFTTLP
eukprot:CAMPEP_0119107298 /NCGR_PEP_ID=MMETSP1180-20130426/9625_1 /TAXON_ID=3052 ORGANISM="Chlamydomonas cf sp, Strain CCMP681" /NCGR_SAMPLE_ID=MMETSP1180 /ASSEMBLY_ACC=CAM_ASM_000741 /LENGTH=262 /DNA_ID=CAMNT_0007092769 /DNA_START=71 /DNA_END=859 /DNA_ORIENTATION=+